jgi:hypothetical protein
MNVSILFKTLTISVLFVFSFQIASAQQATVVVHQNEKIPELLTLKKELEKDNKLSDGWTIQIYSGELGTANSNLRRFRGSHGSWPASLEYETPNYKVWAGDFASRLDAERALLEIKNTFPSAFILKPSR